MEIHTNRDELLHSEGTVLLHLDFALKQNQVLYSLPWLHDYRVI